MERKGWKNKVWCAGKEMFSSPYTPCGIQVLLSIGVTALERAYFI